jgi:hypothetical protein
LPSCTYAGKSYLIEMLVEFLYGIGANVNAV